MGNREDLKQYIRLNLWDCENAQTSKPVQTKEKKMSHMGTTPCQFNNGLPGVH